MKLTIRNPKVSKSGKSMNFQFEGKWYTIKLNLIELKGLTIKSLTNKILEVNKNDIHIRYSWGMIEDFKIDGADNPRYEPEYKFTSTKEVLNVVVPKTTLEFLPKELNLFNSIEPLSIEKAIYADSYSEISWKIIYSILQEAKENQKNSIISATQNFISRGFCVQNNANTKFSFISVLILETLKINDGVQLLIPEIYFEESEKSIIDAQDTLNMFIELTKEKKIVIPENVIRIGESNNIKLIDKDRKILLEVSLVEQYSKDPISFVRKETIKYSDFTKNKVLINKLLKLSFGDKNENIKQFKDEQITALNNIMYGGGNVLAILKTGFGKSLIYQFATLLQPRIFINVFPIVALIKDQSKTIRNEFEFGYSIDNEKLKSVSENKLHKDILYTKRLFLITPERIENQKMQDYFTSLGKYVGYMVFDEAHCISEWGHDFRPSYLMSKRLLENLTKTYDIKVIALTATAAPHIQKDIASLLNIDKKHIVNIADSTGLERKEIRYNIIHKKVYDFDSWNRSKKYAQIIDKHILEASNKYKQLIAFHMKAGSEKDLEKEKYKIKISAFSTYQRLSGTGLKNLTLFTGKQKMIDGVNENNFNELSKSKHIIATKSFGMGINLKDCDYVLLTEPPYSLEDLYQQSGRVGRMGQDSLVEILYHDNVLINPFNNKSPYNYFLLIKDTRKMLQPSALKQLIKSIEKHKGPFTINVDKFLKGIGYQAKEEHLMWAMAHLITKFNIIDRYSVVYKGFRKNQIHIIPSEGASDPNSRIKEALAKMRITTKSLNLSELINAFYNNYFIRLQADKLTGINIFINKLLEVDISGDDNSKIITTVLTEYYKTRVDGVDKFVEELMQLLIKESSYGKLTQHLEDIESGISYFEVMESISRYEIDFEYIITGSVLLNKMHKEKMLATNWNEIIGYKFTNKYLKEVILETIESGLEHIKHEEIEHTGIKEYIQMLEILKGIKNGR